MLANECRVTYSVMTHFLLLSYRKAQFLFRCRTKCSVLPQLEPVIPGSSPPEAISTWIFSNKVWYYGMDTVKNDMTFFFNFNNSLAMNVGAAITRVVESSSFSTNENDTSCANFCIYMEVSKYLNCFSVDQFFFNSWWRYRCRDPSSHFIRYSFINSMIVSPRQWRDPPPGRRRDAAPKGHLADKLFKEGTPSPATGGTLCHGRGEMGEDPCVKTPSPSPPP